MRLIPLAIAFVVAGFMLTASASSACESCGCSAPADHEPMMADAHHSGITSIQGVDLEIRDVEDFYYVYLEGKGMDSFDETFTKLYQQGMNADLFKEDTGIYSFYYGSLLEEPDVDDFVYRAALSVDKDYKAVGMEQETLKGGTYLVAVHQGPYDEVGELYGKLYNWAIENKLEFTDGWMFEKYLNDPNSTPEDELLTEIYIPFNHPVHDEHANMAHSGH